MMAGNKRPLVMMALPMAVLSIPLALMRQLCVPALIMALLALLLLVLDRMGKKPSGKAARSRLPRWALYTALLGVATASTSWLLWAFKVLP